MPSYVLGVVILFIASYFFYDGEEVILRIVAALIFGWFLSLPVASLIQHYAGDPDDK
jgi:hypothetical protein